MPAVYAKVFLLTATAIVIAFCPLRTGAHPHVFVHTGVQIVFDDKGMAGVRVLWIFDEMFSNMIISEFDQNANRKFEPTEVATLKEGAFSYLRNFHYFTHIKIDGNKFTVDFVKDFSADIKENKLIYRFFVPCHVTAIDTFKEVNLAIYDSSYYCNIYLPEQAIAFENMEPYEVLHRLEANPEEAYYFGQVHPEEITLRFRRKGE